ncbi:ctenidin-1-like isoform X1 [Artemia franciscana]|uniref:Uncharacterized protein n=1 Tax=Artemia franciscana TaxID=6661 RepID=A0AA88I1N9_ARTSF|nr:hypothetical protein QYM36_005293 [Artemia franciscana]
MIKIVILSCLLYLGSCDQLIDSAGIKAEESAQLKSYKSPRSYGSWQGSGGFNVHGGTGGYGYGGSYPSYGGSYPGYGQYPTPTYGQGTYNAYGGGLYGQGGYGSGYPLQGGVYGGVYGQSGGGLYGQGAYGTGSGLYGQGAYGTGVGGGYIPPQYPGGSYNPIGGSAYSPYGTGLNQNPSLFVGK